MICTNCDEDKSESDDFYIGHKQCKKCQKNSHSLRAKLRGRAMQILKERHEAEFSLILKAIIKDDQNRRK